MLTLPRVSGEFLRLHTKCSWREYQPPLAFRAPRGAGRAKPQCDAFAFTDFASTLIPAPLNLIYRSERMPGARWGGWCRLLLIVRFETQTGGFFLSVDRRSGAE